MESSLIRRSSRTWPGWDRLKHFSPLVVLLGWWYMDRRKILITDGPELVKGLERAVFRRNRYVLAVAHTGREVLEAVQDDPPDLIFLDLELPQLAGDAVCRRLKDDPRLRHIPVVLVVPEGDAQALARSRSAGCDEVVIRPLRRHQLAHVTRTLLELAARKAPRYEACLEILIGPSEAELTAAHTLNLGTGGALIESDQPLPVDAVVALEIVLPGARTNLKCRGRVAWVYPVTATADTGFRHEMGIEFFGLAVEEKVLLRAYVEMEGLNPSL